MMRYAYDSRLRKTCNGLDFHKKLQPNDRAAALIANFIVIPGILRRAWLKVRAESSLCEICS